MAVATATSVFSERARLHMQIHQAGSQSTNTEVDRIPIQLPISVYYDSDTNILEVWCDNDNIQAEVYVFDENEVIEYYSPNMNISVKLISENSHYIFLKGDQWESRCYF